MNRRGRKRTQPTHHSGWLSPKIAIPGIVLAGVFAAYHVARALYPRYDWFTTVSVTFIAFITPIGAAALTFFLRRKMVGS